jgi:hypothetical protein
MRAAVAQWRKNLDLARWVMRENETLPPEVKLHILSYFEGEHFICTGCGTRSWIDVRFGTYVRRNHMIQSPCVGYHVLLITSKRETEG